MFDKIISAGKNFAKVTSLKVEKHMPEILVATAIVTGAAAIYESCKATHDSLDDILLQAEKELQVLATQKNDGILPEKEAFKQRAQVKLETAGKLVRIYAPAAVLATISASCTVGAHHILTKRNVALMASYAALDRYTKAYQKRVLDTVGEEIERKIRYDIYDDGRDVEMYDPETGEKEVVKEKTGFEKAHTLDRFDFVFDETSRLYQNNSDYDETFCYMAEEYANKVLESRRTNTKPGYYFLDELLDQFDLDPSDVNIPFEDAHINGWYLPPKNESGVAAGDLHHITLGLGTHLDKAKRDMMRDDGSFKGILIHPNCDGVIYHII